MEARLRGLVRTRPVVAYVVLAVGITWLAVAPLVLAAGGVLADRLPEWYHAVGAAGPPVAAALVMRIVAGWTETRRLLAAVLRWRLPPQWLLVAVLSPFAIFAVAVGVVALGGSTPAFDPDESRTAWQWLAGVGLSAAATSARRRAGGGSRSPDSRPAVAHSTRRSS